MNGCAGCEISIEGILPRAIGISKRDLKLAANYFAVRSSRRIGVPFQSVTVILQRDSSSALVHEAINGVSGPTDVVTQRYDAMPGETEGVYGEIYVNCDQAVRSAPKLLGWSSKKELLLYVAHGFDHLSGAEDLEWADRVRMRRRELRWLKSFLDSGNC